MRNDRPMGRTLNEPVPAPVRPGRGCGARNPGTVVGMIRHVVVFTWSPDADADRRAATVEALRGLEQAVGGMTSLTVADDAGLVDGNASTVLIADFPDVEAFSRYAQDPVHLAVIAEHVRPVLASRSAVQYRF